MIIKELSNDDKDEEKKKEQHMVVKHLLDAFPDKTNSTSWYSLHWAVVAKCRLIDEEVKLIHAADPIALEKHHLQGNGSVTGFSPAHLLCMLKNAPLTLTKFLSGHNQKAFSAPCSNNIHLNQLQFGRYALHLAAEYCNSTVLLQILLQLNVSITKKTASSYVKTPLGLLFARQEFPFQINMVHCLVEADNCVEVMSDAIKSYLRGFAGNVDKDHSLLPGSTGLFTLMLMNILMTTNPELCYIVYVIILKVIYSRV